MQNYHDPHAQIIEVGFAPINSVQIVSQIGSQEIDIVVSGQEMFPMFEYPSSASFSEKKAASGDYVDQELEVVFTSSEADYVDQHRQWIEQDGLVLVRYTNGQVLVAGTEEAPCRCEIDESGSPRTLRVLMKRKSPEFAKVLKSLR